MMMIKMMMMMRKWSLVAQDKTLCMHARAESRLWGELSIAPAAGLPLPGACVEASKQANQPRASTSPSYSIYLWR